MRGGGGLFPAMNRDDIGRFSQRTTPPSEVSLVGGVEFSADSHDPDCPAYTSPHADCECGSDEEDDDGSDISLAEYERQRAERDNDW